MKKFLIYFFIAILSIILFLLTNVILGISIDFLNLILSNSIFKWFYSAYNIVWKWSFWNYCLVAIISYSITHNIISKLINKLKEKELL